MTPKEKAEKLMGYYYYYINHTKTEDKKDICRHCAIIAVEELIDCSISYDNYNATWASQVEYWKEVKRELQMI